MRTRLVSMFIASLFAFPLVLAGCGGSDEEAFDTLQECYDDHHAGSEGLSVLEAITVCCIDHPIDGEHPSCGNTAAECTTHVDAELDATVTAAEIQAACAEYITEK